MALTDYEKYIRTEELLALQKPEADLTCADERQFQIVHQVAELWMKLIEFELLRHSAFLVEDNAPRAISLMRRVNMIQKCTVQQLDLLDTMSPKDYMIVRTGLGRGSGQESPGFKTMLRLPGETVWPAFSKFLDARGKTLREVYEDPDGCHEIFQVAEGLVDYDQLLQAWRYRHLMIVYRIIGVGTPSLKGKPSELLAHGMKQRFFPKLWEVRDELFSAWTQAMADKGKETGYHG